MEDSSVLVDAVRTARDGPACGSLLHQSYTMTLNEPGTIVGRPGLPSAPVGPGL